MKRIAFTLTTIAVIFASGLTYTQEAAEKLKVLEPLVGTFIIDGENIENGTKCEWVNSIDWNGPSKSMPDH